MRRLYYSFALLCVAVTTIAAARFGIGGWAVITVDDLPDHAVASKPVSLSYVVRQHGVTKLNDLQGSIDARLVGGGSGDMLRVAARRSAKDGQYAGIVTFPRAGEWLVTIRSGFMESKLTLLPITVVSHEGTAVRATSMPERGKQLFVAKGCVTCHVHDQLASSSGLALGPELSGRKYASEYLAKFLDDPSIKPPTNGRRMPKLELQPREIAALTAFINGDQPRVSSK